MAVNNQELQNYLSLFNDPNSAQALDMIIANPQSVLQNRFFQLPNYQLLYGNTSDGAMIPPTAPTAPNLSSIQQQITNQQMMDYVKQNTSREGELLYYTGAGSVPGVTMTQGGGSYFNFPTGRQGVRSSDYEGYLTVPSIKSAIQQQLAPALFDSAQSTYNKQFADYQSTLQAQAQKAAMPPEAVRNPALVPSNTSNAPVERYLASPEYQLFNPAVPEGTKVTDLAEPIPSRPEALTQEQFFANPLYGLMFGAGNTQANPTDRFRADPGYQFQMDEGLRAITNQAAARGLLESGPMLKEMQNYAGGLADQNYQRWLGNQSNLYNNLSNQQQTQYQQDIGNRALKQNEFQTFLQNQAGLFNNYQSQLANVSSMGAGQTGNQNAFNLGSYQGSAQLGTGANQAQAAQNTGSNISSLFANQGVYGGNAYMGNAAAQANNIFQAQGMNAQIQSANNANQAGTFNSLFGGIGSYLGNQQQGGGINGYRY